MLSASEPPLAIDGLEVVGQAGFRLLVERFAVEPGEVVAVIGANGSGKTTLIETIVGLRRLKRGTVSVLGTRNRPLPTSVRRRLGVQLQSASFEPTLTVREIVAMHHAGSGRNDPALAEALDIGKLRDNTYGKCSGGQKQRVHLYTALSRAPDLVLLDEPSAGLDAQAAAALRALVAGVDRRGTGRALVIVTHLNADARLADRVVWLDGGTFVAEGPLGRLVADHLGEQRLEVRHAPDVAADVSGRLGSMGLKVRGGVDREDGMATIAYGPRGFEQPALARLEGAGITGYAVGAAGCEDLLAATD